MVCIAMALSHAGPELQFESSRVRVCRPHGKLLEFHHLPV